MSNKIGSIGWSKKHLAQVPVSQTKQAEKPVALLVADVRGWAFSQNLTDLAEYLKDDFDFRFLYVAETPEIPKPNEYDVVFLPYHRWYLNDMFPRSKRVGSLRGFWFDPQKQSSSLEPNEADIQLVNSYAAFHFVERFNYNMFAKKCPNAVYLTNPVNMRRFPLPTDIKGEIVASWNGNAQHGNNLKLDVKGFDSIVKPACEAASVRLVSAEYNTNRLTPAEMPDFYRKANVCLCASMYEGASNSTMEAMASGQVLITTDCGNHREIQEKQLERFGRTGIIITDRSVEAFAKALKNIKKRVGMLPLLGALNRASIEREWSWTIWAEKYRRFLMSPIQNKSSAL